MMITSLVYKSKAFICCVYSYICTSIKGKQCDNLQYRRTRLAIVWRRFLRLLRSQCFALQPWQVGGLKYSPALLNSACHYTALLLLRCGNLRISKPFYGIYVWEQPCAFTSPMLICHWFVAWNEWILSMNAGSDQLDQVGFRQVVKQKTHSAVNCSEHSFLLVKCKACALTIWMEYIDILIATGFKE